MHTENEHIVLRIVAGIFLATALSAVAPVSLAGVEEDFERGARAHRQGDTAKSVAIWRALAEKGQVDAQYNLGVIYHHADGVARDYAEALKWYRKAAEQGDKPAQFQLGGMYQRGEGVAADEAHAHRWFTAHLASHHQHQHSAQMVAWRKQARELLWARDMSEALARTPDAVAAQLIADLRRRAEPARVATGDAGAAAQTLAATSRP